MITAELLRDREAGLVFETFPRAAHDALLSAIRELTAELQGAVEAAVPVKTGSLQSHVRTYVDDDGDRLSGKVKISGDPASGIYAKAAALEYGAHAHVHVTSYTRQVSTVFGRLVSPTTQIVGAYERTANIAEHSFLRAPLGNMSAGIVERLKAAVESAEQP